MTPRLKTLFVKKLVRWLSRRSMRWCYREVHYIGREHIPASGPVLLIGNHPNDLPDVLAGFFTTERQVRYLATVSATTMPLAAATYRGLGVIPVMRVRDVRGMRERGVDGAAVNASAFAQVNEAFGQGEVIGIFPEGGVHDTPHVGKFRAGVAKMALDALDDGAISDIFCVPFGMQYEASQTLRSDLIVEIGPPISLRRWHIDNPERQAGALSSLLHQKLEAQTRSSHTWEAAGQRDVLIAAVAAVVAQPTDRLLDVAASVKTQCARLIEGRDQMPRDVADWQSIARPLSNAVARAKGIPTSARDVSRVLSAAGVNEALAQWPSAPWVLLSAPIASLGLLLHWPLWKGARRLARRFTEVRTDPMAKTILPGLHLIFLGYLILSGVSAIGFRLAGLSAWWSLVLLVVLPRLGDLALTWLDAVRAIRLRGRVRRWSVADRSAVVTAARQLRSSWAMLADSSQSLTPRS